MCLAIFKKANASIPENHLKNGYESNHDGCGIAYPDGNGKVIVKKGLWTWEQFLSEYNQVPIEKPMLIHFRWSTCAGENLENCHPFSMYDEKFAMIHNGHIAIKLHEDMSDTGTFAHLVLEPMLRAGISPSKPAFKFLIEQTIGSGNKVAVMDGNGDVEIYNAEKGTWEDNGNVWYSNNGYKYAKSTVRTYFGHGAQEEYEYNYYSSKKKQSTSENSCGSNGNGCGGTGSLNTDVANRDKFSDEIELEINFCQEELSFTRQQAIDYLLYEGVLEKDEEGKVKESNSNHSLMGM